MNTKQDITPKAQDTYRCAQKKRIAKYKGWYFVKTY